MFKIDLIDPSTVMLAGRFDAMQAQTAESMLKNIEGDCVLDCRELEYISSAGIGVILAAYKRLNDQGCTLRMSNADNHIRQVFRYAGLDKILMGGEI